MTDHMACRHDRGDYVLTYWLCAECFQKLQERPKRYKMVSSGALCYRNEDGPEVTSPLPKRQEISWQAIIAISKEGITFGRFIGMVAERFVRRGRLRKDEAIDMAIEALRGLHNLGDKFGDKDFSWDREAANQIADDEMSYWDCDGAGGNG